MTQGFRREGLSPDFYREIYKPETSYVLLHLVDFQFRLPNENEDRILHFVDDYTPLDFNEGSGVITTYQPASFKLNLGNDSADNTPTVTLMFDSGDRSIIRLLREVDERPTVRVSAVLSPANKNFVVSHREIGPLSFQLTDFSFKATAVTLTLKVEPILTEPVPSALHTPTLSPSLWVDEPIPVN